MKTPVTLLVPIDDDWDAGTRLQVFADRGTGTIDYNAPLLSRAKEVFPGAVAVAGYGEQVFGEGTYGLLTPDRPRSGGYGDQVYSEGSYGDSEPFIEITVNVPATFGSWKFAVKAIDGHGNVQTAAAVELTRLISATEPPTVKSFAFSSFDSGADVVTFSIELNTE